MNMWLAPPPKLAPPRPSRSPFAPPDPFGGKPDTETVLAPPGWLDDDGTEEEKRPSFPPSYSDIRPQEEPLDVGPRDRGLEWHVTLISFVTYVVAAVWIRVGLGYGIGDALSRNANARAMLESRFSGIAPVGFVWMPLPTMLQTPLIFVLEKFGLSYLAGPLLTAICGAVTAFVLTRTCRKYGLSDRFTMCLVLLFTLNPVVIFHQAIGMSEGVYFPCLAVLLYGYLGWTERPSTKSMLIMAAALAAGTAVRYETLAVVPIMAVAVSAQHSKRLAGYRSGFILALPPFYVFFLWLLANRLVVGSAFFWKRNLDQMASPPDQAYWLPKDRTILTGLFYSARLSVLMAPGLVVLVPWLFGRRKKIGVGNSTGLIALSTVFPAWIVYLMFKNQTWGNPRYFAPLILFTTVISIALLARRRSGEAAFTRFSWVAHAVILIVAAIGVASGSLALTNKTTAAVESEWIVFRSAFGTSDTYDVVNSWRRTTDAIDAELKRSPKTLVAIEMGLSFPAFLYSSLPGRYMIDSDRDYEATVSGDLTGIDLVFLAPGRPTLLRAAVARTSASWSDPVKLPTGELYIRKKATPGG
jgi:hypothetical protein